MKKLFVFAAFSLLVLGCITPAPGDIPEAQIIPNISITGVFSMFGENVSDGGSVYERIQYLRGNIYNISTYNAKISVNGIETTVPVGTDGSFDQEIILLSGNNSISLTVSNGTHDLASESFLVRYENPENAAAVILRFETNLTDLDLHLWDPRGRHTYRDQLNGIPNAGLSIYGEDGFGTEIIEIQIAIAGNYTAKVRYKNNTIQGSNETYTDPVDAWVYLVLNESSVTKYGPHTFTADMAQGDNDSNDWFIANFSVPGGREMIGCGGSTKSAAELVSIGDVAECEEFGKDDLDESWYKLVLTNATNRVNVSTTSPATCDLLQLYLWNWENKQVDASARSMGNEYIAKTLTNGTYYIEVRQQKVLYCRWNDFTMNIKYY